MTCHSTYQNQEADGYKDVNSATDLTRLSPVFRWNVPLGGKWFFEVRLITYIGSCSHHQNQETEMLHQQWGFRLVLNCIWIVVQSLSCIRLCNPKDCNPLGSSVHSLPEFAQIHVHWVITVLPCSILPFLASSTEYYVCRIYSFFLCAFRSEISQKIFWIHH